MSGLNVGQASTDPVSGVAGAIWTATYANTNSNINPAYVPAPPALAPSPGTLTPQQLAIRKNLAAAMESQAAAIASFLSYGSGTIPSGQNHVVIADAAVNASSVIAPAAVTSPAAPPDTTCNEFTYTVNPGVSVTITANGTPTAVAGVNVTYLALNPP